MNRNEKILFLLKQIQEDCVEKGQYFKVNPDVGLFIKEALEAFWYDGGAAIPEDIDNDNKIISVSREEFQYRGETPEPA